MTVLRRSASTVILALAAAGAALLGAVPAASQGGRCPAFDPPELTVRFDDAPVTRDFSRSVRQLASLPGRAPGPRGAGRGHVLGLAQAAFRERSEVAIAYQRQPDGSVCGALSSVEVTFGAEERTVYVARELPAGSCIHGEVLQHEMRHVAVDTALLKEYRPMVRQRLQAVVDRVGTKRGRSQSQVLSALRRPVEQELKRVLDAFARDRERRQARIDTVDEYERVSRSCDGEVAKYVDLKGRR